ncbi:MAG: hypothetical protein E6G32_08060 [Actinobacteria bacterium]|nr:MAG: hypothetical protein E6G32_08060 [Actinomycetota bacterium]
MAQLRGFVALVLIGLVVCLGATRSAASDSLETRLGFYICPNVTTTIYPQTPEQQTLPGCGSPVMSPNDNNPTPPGGDPCLPASTNTDLGVFLTTQNPFGAFVASGTPNNCATNPHTRGRGTFKAALDVSVVQRGFCPTTLTVAAHEGPLGGVFFPIGTLPLGTYNVTVTLPAQTVNEPTGPVSWLGVQVRGTLRVGTTFTETDTSTLAVGTKTFATLLDNSFAGPGAGKLMMTKSALSGTEYYACGTINVAASMTIGKRGRVRGEGLLTGGKGNYQGIRGTFTLAGRYNTRTKRGTFVLKGEATY